MKFEARVKFEKSRTYSTVIENLGPATKKFVAYDFSVLPTTR